MTKTNCRNRVNSSVYNSDTMPPGTSGTTAGSTVDWWDTIDSMNNYDSSIPTAQPTDWSTENLCGKELWSDNTADGSCDSAADDCMIKDNVTGLTWSESHPVTGQAASMIFIDWSQAIQHCRDLNFGGETNWRLPNQMEMSQAHSHGIRQLGNKGGSFVDSLDNNAHFIAHVDFNFWTATSSATTTSSAWVVLLGRGNIFTTNKSTSFGTHVICVSP